MDRRILVVEGTEDLATAMIQRLRRLGCAVDWASDGRQALDRLDTGAYHLVVLDLTLPDLDGTLLLGRLRGRGDGPPVLVVTAWLWGIDGVDSPERAADDYVVKPFALRELEARCRRLLQRPPGLDDGGDAGCCPAGNHAPCRGVAA